MPDTPTPNLGLIKPTVGGDADVWGQMVNANSDTLDDVVSEVQSRPTWLSGALAPGNEQGEDGDFYLERTAGAYGSGVSAVSLANLQIGSYAGVKYRAANRFRAHETGNISSLMYYKQGNAGYADGTGGTLRIMVQTDDGTEDHLPTGDELAREDTNPSIVGPEILTVTLNPPAAVVAGTLYHVVWENTDADEEHNYVSVNNLFHVDPVWVPNQPRFDDTEWFLNFSVALGDPVWIPLPEYTNILALTYESGFSQGMGYIESWEGGAYSIQNTLKVRERFTPTANQNVGGVGINVRRISGTGALSLRLETAAGTEVETVTIPAADISTATVAQWYHVDYVDRHTLVQGTTYNLRLSCAAGTEYEAYACRKGVEYDFPVETYYAEGVAQHDPGTGVWVNFDQPGGTVESPQGDLGFYFDSRSAQGTIYGPKETAWDTLVPFAVGDHAASEVGFSPTGNITSTTVQDAIEEVISDGIFPTLTVGDTQPTEWTNTYRVIFDVAANEKVDLHFTGAFAGALEIELTSGFNGSDATGVIVKRYALGLLANGTIYRMDTRYTDAFGVTATKFALSDLTWDAGNSRFKIQVVHRDNTANYAYIRVRALAQEADTLTSISGMAQGTLYTSDATAFAVPVVKFDGSTAMATAALATNATAGFLYIPTCAGTPSGTPVTNTGTVPIVYDTTNHKLYVYDGGWKGGTTPGAFT